jgi:hypothetical protein
VKCSLVLMDESSDQVFIGIVGVPESGKSVECIQHNKQEAWLQPGSNFLKQPYLECCTMCLTINVFPFGIYVSYIWVTTMHTDPLIKSTHILHLQVLPFALLSSTFSTKKDSRITYITVVSIDVAHCLLVCHIKLRV